MFYLPLYLKSDHCISKMMQYLGLTEEQLLNKFILNALEKTEFFVNKIKFLQIDPQFIKLSKNNL